MESKKINTNNYRIKYSEDKIIENCKKFLTSRIINLFPQKSKDENIFQKFINLSSIKIKSNNTQRIQKISINKKLNCLYKSKKNNTIISKCKKELNKNKYINLRTINSAKRIWNNNKKNNIRKNIIQSKVNETVKKLLSKNNVKIMKKSFRDENYSLNHNKNKTKYLTMVLREEPSKVKTFRTYKTQMKYFLDKNRIKSLIEGNNDYHLNLKCYNEIFFESFSSLNMDKTNFVKAKNLNLTNIYNENKSVFMKTNYKIGNKFNKFKNDYIQAYDEWKFNYNNRNNDKYINNHSYFKFMSKKRFNNMMSIDEKINLLENSIKNDIKIQKQNSLKNIKKKYFY